MATPSSQRSAARRVSHLPAAGDDGRNDGIVRHCLRTARHHIQFPLRRVLSAALVLPLAIPSYLAAYAFGEFLDFTGPVQSALRAVFGYHSIRDYWFPDVRSLGGAVVVLSSVLYPYVYLSARAAFSMQGRFAAEAARTLGAKPLGVFFSVQLPMARPAIAIGLSLVLMETLNDIGAVEYLGVQTLTFTIYETGSIAAILPMRHRSPLLFCSSSAR